MLRVYRSIATGKESWRSPDLNRTSLPTSECFQQAGLDAFRNFEGRHSAERFNRESHLIEISHASWTDRQMLLEPCAFSRQQSLFQVIRYQLGHFLAGYFRFCHDRSLGARRLNSNKDFQEYHVLLTAPDGAVPSD